MYPPGLDKATRRTPRMDRQIEKIIGILSHSPMTVEQLANAIFVSRHTAGNYVRLLYNAKPKRIYVGGWLPTQANKPTRIYSVGNHKDVKYFTKRQKSVDTRTANSQAVLIKLLALPQTVRQLSERSGISKSRTRALVSMLKTEKRIHIKAWLLPEIKGSQAPVYAIGNLSDAVRVRRRTQTDRRAAKRNGKVQAKSIFATIQQQPSPENESWKNVHLPDGPVRIFRQAA